MTSAETRLVVDMLKRMSDELGNRGCNDYDLSRLVPDVCERNLIVRSFHAWNGDSDEYTTAPEGPDYRLMDYMVCDYLVDVIRRES